MSLEQHPNPEQPLVDLVTAASKAINQYIHEKLFDVNPRRAINLNQEIQNHLLDVLQALEPQPDRRYGKDSNTNNLGLGALTVPGFDGVDFASIFTEIFEKIDDLQKLKKTPAAELRTLEDAIGMAEKLGDTVRLEKLKERATVVLDQVVDGQGGEVRAALPPVLLSGDDESIPF